MNYANVESVKETSKDFLHKKDVIPKDLCCLYPYKTSWWTWNVFPFILTSLSPNRRLHTYEAFNVCSSLSQFDTFQVSRRRKKIQ